MKWIVCTNFYCVFDLLFCRCYSFRTIKPFMCQNLKSIYYSYFHSLMAYGVIFWGSSTHSIHVFQLQNRVIRIITESRPRDSCRQLFKKLGILPLTSQYTFSLLLFTVNNKALFQINFEIRSINFSSTTCQFDNIQNGTYYTGIKSFQLPPHSHKKFIS